MTSFFMAWQMFLWIPCPSHKWDDSKRKEMLLWYPVTALINGGLWYLIYYLFTSVGRGIGPVAAAVLAVFPWLVTGFMQLDGYMDCADAALYFGKREKKLEILKDSHVGSFAVISTAVLAILQYAAFMQIGVIALSLKEALALVFIPALTRCLVVESIFMLKPLPTSSYAGLCADIKVIFRIIPILMVVSVLAAVYFLCGWKVFCALLIGTFVEDLIILYLRKNLGGISGDISGAAVTAGELACLIALAFI